MFKNWTFKKHIVFSLILVIIVFYVLPIMGMGLVFLNIFWGSHEAGSIGIIGGADGPTAIFLASKLIRTCGYFGLIYMVFTIDLHSN